MKNTSRFWAAGLACLCAFPCCATTAQSPGNTAKLKPAELLAAAAAQNGLGNLNTPWHVLMRFESFDSAGAPENAGTFEEWWFGPKSYKSIFKSEHLNQTDVATERGLYRAGDQKWPASEEHAPEIIASPLAIFAPNLNTVELLTQTIGKGDAEMRCVSYFPAHRPDQHIGTNMPRDVSALPSTCFPKDSAILLSRSSGPGNPVLIVRKVARFAGRYVAADAAIVQNGKSLFTAQVLQLNAIPGGTAAPEPSQDSTGPLRGPIEPPADWVRIASGEAEYREAIMHAVPPNQATEVKTRIDLDPSGHVRHVEIESGPPQLSAVVAKATYKLTFEPIEILGTPVEATVERTESFDNTSGAPGASRRR